MNWKTLWIALCLPLVLAAAGCAGLLYAAREPLAALPQTFSFLDPIDWRTMGAAMAASLPIVIALVGLFALPQIARAASRPLTDLL